MQKQQGGGGSKNGLVVPQAKAAMQQLKFETAQELGVQIPQGGYMGDLPSRVNGSIGGEMVRKMIQAYEQQRAGQ